MPRKYASLLFAVGLAGCQFDLTHEDLDRLNRSIDVRTIILEDDFSVYSVFSFEETVPYAKIVREELDLVSALFDVRIEKPILGKLLGVDEITPTVHATANSITAKWLGGTAGDGGFSIFLTDEFHVRGPNGKTITVQLSENKYRSVIRHEIAHVCVELLGIEEKLWLTEGVAEEVESMEVVAGDGEQRPRLISRLLPENLRLAMELAAERRSLVSVLSLHQDGDKIAKGLEDIDTEGRALCHALVRFYIHRNRGESFAQVLRRMDAMPEREIAALENEFYDWLEGLAAPPGPPQEPTAG